MALRIKPELAISALALVLSVVAVASSVYYSSVRLQTTVLPYLVFVYDRDKKWSLRNVGNGVGYECRGLTPTEPVPSLA